MGGMGGAQPLAATLNGAAFLGIDVDPERIKRRVKAGYCDVMVNDLDEALRILKNAVRKREATSVGLVGNCADVIPALARRGVVPDLLTDQTSAHDPVGGYIPQGLNVAQAAELRKKDAAGYRKRALESIGKHVEGMLALQKLGSVTFDYGNNIRTLALEQGVGNVRSIFPGSCPHTSGRCFAKGRGRSGGWRFLGACGHSSHRPAGAGNVCGKRIAVPVDRLAQKRVRFQGLLARICWLGYERDKFGVALNDLVARGELKAPVVIGRDHLDCGSVASPFRETESMRDGSDAIADWPFLNALLNTASGAIMSIHNGGGVGIGYAQHAGKVVVADGSKEMRERIERVLTNDPGIGIVRHADAGYPEAVEFAKKARIKMPMGFGSGE